MNETLEKLGTLNIYREKASEYTVADLDKELAYELKKTGFSAFSKDTHQGIVPKDVPLHGVDAILAKYVK